MELNRGSLPSFSLVLELVQDVGRDVNAVFWANR
jgi:hypothetical protein